MGETKVGEGALLFGLVAVAAEPVRQILVEHQMTADRVRVALKPAAGSLCNWPNAKRNPNMTEQMKSRIIELAANQVGVDPADVTTAHHFRNDLAYDSLDGGIRHEA